MINSGSLKTLLHRHLDGPWKVLAKMGQVSRMQRGL